MQLRSVANPENSSQLVREKQIKRFVPDTKCRTVSKGVQLADSFSLNGLLRAIYIGIPHIFLFAVKKISQFKTNANLEAFFISEF